MRNRNAFSLVELLIVISLIILMLALAMPAFHFITGSSSVDGGMNQISAFLGRARTEAVGLQEIRGVMFYIDPATEREMMVLVKQTEEVGTNPNVDVWLDAGEDDHIPLPKGVGIELLNDGSSSAIPDRYTGFNSYTDGAAGQTRPAGGVILFDGYGRLTSARYGFRMNKTGTDSSGNPAIVSTAMANLLLLIPPVSPPPHFTPNAISPPHSSFGFVLFDHGTFKDRGFDDADPSPVDTAEETWIDENATAVLINRYNGTLVRGE